MQDAVFRFIDAINATHGRKNIFYAPYRARTFLLSEEIITFLRANQRELNAYLTGLRPDHREAFYASVIMYATHKAIETIVALNQFVDVEQHFVKHIQAVYEAFVPQLFRKFLSSNPGSLMWVAPLVRSHQHMLRAAFGTVEELRIFPTDHQYLEPVPCSEYSASLQLDVLGIQPEEVMGPVLDVGCGKQARLIYEFRSRGIEAYGIDRTVENSAWTMQQSWFDMPLEPMSWGTILSHLAFTNHCLRHHIKQRGKYVDYAMTYMNILRALKIGGSFHYTPDVPFLEQYLPHLSIK